MDVLKSVSCFLAVLAFSPAQATVQSYLEQIKKDPNALYEFFKKMPKGGELHYHVAGGPFPETMLSIAAEDNYCLNTETFAVSKSNAPCQGVNTQDLAKQPFLYAQTVRSWSMKDFIPGAESGHDHFFNSFAKFIPIVNDHEAELIAEIIQRAAQQQEQYMELMVSLDNGHSMSFGALLSDDLSFDEKRELLLVNQDFQNNITYTANEAEHLLKQVQQKLDCTNNPQNEGCQVRIKFLMSSLREQPFNNLFAQTLNAFEAVARAQKQGGNLVGVNLVQPEDGIISLRDYHQHMLMFQYLHKLYPQVNISLHAGEITQEIVPPKELDYHIHDALFVGQAQRIGHGVDIAYENDALDTLNYMASQHKAIEVNLISNLKILNVSGDKHPLNYYLSHHVPVVLSTDDEGILRTNLTTQYVDAVLNHDLSYQSIKQINRNALTYAFVPGKSIWGNADTSELIQECQDLNSEHCKEFIKNNEKAQLQWNLEKKLNTFEKGY